MEARNQKIKWNKGLIFLYILLAVLLVKFIIVDDLLSVLRSAFGEFITAMILIYLLSPVVKYLEKRFNLKRSYGVTVSFILMLAIVVGTVLLISPALVDSIQTLISTIPQYTEVVDELLTELDLERYNISPELLSSLYEEFNSILVELSQSLMGMVTVVLTSAGNFVNFLAQLSIALLLAWYGLKEFKSIGSNLQEYIRILLPERQGKYVQHTLELLDEGMHNFIVGKLMTCLILAAMTYVTMAAFNILTPYDIPYVPLMTFIIGVFNIIPYIGPILGAIPCIFLALFTGIPEAVAVIVICVVLQQVDNMVVGPRILGTYVGVSPFWTIAFMSIGGAIGGIFGMIVAIPLGKVLLTLSREFMDERRGRHEQPITEQAE